MPHVQKIPVIGVVGGIGSGKSTVADEFERLGCYRIDCDKLGHALLAEDDVKKEILAQFGPSVFDSGGEVNRSAVADIVFHDAQQLQSLEHILHPRIREEIIRRVAEAAGQKKIAVVVDAAVLFEAGWDDLCTYVIFVDAPVEERLARVKERRGWDAHTLQLRESNQIPLDKKQKRCHHSVRLPRGSQRR